MEILNNNNILGTDLHYRGPRGYSAYEIAVQNGFEGTEQEWLEYLRDYTFNHYKTDYDNYSNEKYNEIDNKIEQAETNIEKTVTDAKSDINNSKDSIISTLENKQEDILRRTENKESAVLDDIEEEYKNAINEIEKLIAYITNHRAEIDPNAEIIEARSGNSTLNARLNNLNIELFNKLNSLKMLKTDELINQNFYPYINSQDIQIIEKTITLNPGFNQYTEDIIDYPINGDKNSTFVISAATYDVNEILPKTFGWTLTPNLEDFNNRHFPIQVHLYPADDSISPLYNNKIRVLIQNLNEGTITIKYSLALYTVPFYVHEEPIRPIR